MLTPRTNGGPWERLYNPTWIPLVLHRFIGNLVLAGFVIAGYAGWRLRKHAGGPDESYYAQFLQTGLWIGLLSLILQPATGLFYAWRIEDTVPLAYAQLTEGAYQGYLYAQFVLIVGLFLGGLAMLRLTMPARPPLTGGVMSAAAGIALAIVVTAPWPNLRRPLTFVLAGLVIWSVYRLRARFLDGSPAQFNRPIVRRTAIMMGIVSLLTYLTMGTIRETTRRPDTVRGIISLQDELHQPAADRHQQ